MKLLVATIQMLQVRPRENDAPRLAARYVVISVSRDHP